MHFLRQTFAPITFFPELELLRVPKSESKSHFHLYFPLGRVHSRTLCLLPFVLLLVICSWFVLGTGKNFVARPMHALGKKANAPFTKFILSDKTFVPVLGAWQRETKAPVRKSSRKHRNFCRSSLIFKVEQRARPLWMDMVKVQKCNFWSRSSRLFRKEWKCVRVSILALNNVRSDGIQTGTKIGNLLG